MLDKPARKHHVGLALSGGGAKGFVHVGILKAFDEYGIKPEIISGVSAGSIVSVLYASGYGYKEILDMFKNSHFSDFIKIPESKPACHEYRRTETADHCLRDGLRPRCAG